MFDLFGDYLRYRGGTVRLRTLIELMGAFDVPEASVRVVVTRMRSEGWLQGTRSGREASYGLTDASWRLLDEGPVADLRPGAERLGRLLAHGPVPGPGDRTGAA